MSETTQLSAAFRNLESREHLIFLVSREYGLVHGQGFWAGVEVSSETNAPISDPFLLRDPWPEGLRFPDQATMAALAAAHRGAWLAERIAQSQREARAARLGGIRERVNREIGDSETRMGRLATLASILLPIALVDVALLDAEDPKDAAKLQLLEGLAGGADIRAKAAELLDQIQSGELVLTAAAYDLGAVLTEILEDSTKAAAILKDAGAGVDLEGQA